MKENEIDIEKAVRKLALRQRLYYIIVSLITIIVLYFIYRYSDSVNQVEIAHKDLKSTEQLVTELQNENSAINNRKEKIECKGIFVRKQDSDKDALYEFTLIIADSLLSSKLSSVDYFFDHPTYTPKLRTSVDSLHNFRFSYFASGCLGMVQVYLHYKNSSNCDTLFYPMCSKVKVELNPQFNIYKPENDNYYIINGFFHEKSSAIVGYLQSVEMGYYNAKILSRKNDFYLSIYNDNNYDKALYKMKTEIYKDFHYCWMGIGKNGEIKKVN